MACDSIKDKLARTMLADYGVSIIWKLHEDAATLYRIGNSVAAESFLILFQHRRDPAPVIGQARRIWKTA